MDVLYLIFTLVVIFPLRGAQCFGDHKLDPVYWGGLERWTDHQEALGCRVVGHTRFFTIFFIVPSNFILVNIYSALVVLTEIHHSMEVFEDGQEAERLRLHALKKHAVGKRHREEVRERQELQAGDPSLFRRLVLVFKCSLCPDDIMVGACMWRPYGNIAATSGKMKEEQENNG